MPSVFVYKSRKPKYRRRKVRGLKRSGGLTRLFTASGSRGRSDSQGSLSSRRMWSYTNMGRGIGFPKQNTIRLRYCDYVEIQPVLTGIAKVQFRANSVYDPNASIGGHQPMAFDQWAQLYNHYRVLKSNITATIVNGGQMATNCGYAAGIALSDDTTTPTDWEHFAELGKGQQKIIAPNINRSVILSSAFVADKFFSPYVDLGDTSAPVTTNPQEEAFYTVYVQPLDKSTTGGSNAQLRVVIDFLVTFFEPKDLAQS